MSQNRTQAEINAANRAYAVRFLWFVVGALAIAIAAFFALSWLGTP